MSIEQAKSLKRKKAIGQIELGQVAESIDFDHMVLEEQGSYFDRTCIVVGDIAESVTKQMIEEPIAWLDTDQLQDMTVVQPECMETRSHMMNLDNISSLDTCGQLLISHPTLSNSKLCWNFASLSGYSKSCSS